MGPRPQSSRGVGGVPMGTCTNSRYCFACGGTGHIRMHCPIYLPLGNRQITGLVHAGRPLISAQKVLF